MTVHIDMPAPAFSLPDQNGDAVSLDDLEGKKALIVFIPFPFTGICDEESCTIRDRLTALNAFDANVVVVTCHAVPVTKKWSEENGFTFPILSDFWPHGAVAAAYGAFNDEVGASNRVSVVLDADGAVREIIDSGSLGTGREFDEYVSALARVG